ncbi:DUF3105 domain-containing protein [Candidatus Pacebacteria bacterium]|nr:DUF3105 domain-containing protein [Candidatus Paceibacterota bacterium]
MKGIIITIVVSILLIAGLVFVAGSKNRSADNLANLQIEGVQEYERPDRAHTEEDVDYELSPPVGGPHDPIWLDCNASIYDEEVRNENAVHALEHGAVWITYNSSTTPEQIDTLKSKVRGYTFMSPYETQPSTIMLTAWGHQLSLDSADDERVDLFLQKFRQGAQTPEPGATCFATDTGVMN